MILVAPKRPIPVDNRRKITISYYSHSKNEYVPIEDMPIEHLVNVIYKSVNMKDEYLANFKVTDNNDGSFTEATMTLSVSPNFMRGVGS